MAPSPESGPPQERPCLDALARSVRALDALRLRMDRRALLELGREVAEAAQGAGVPDVSDTEALVEDLAAEAECAALAERLETLIARCRQAVKPDPDEMDLT